MLPANHFNKPHRQPHEIVTDLEAKGLIIPDKLKAEAFIKAIGYSRLRIYFLSRRDENNPAKPFRNDVTFDHISQLYELDEVLRIKVFQYCCRFELILRNSISESLSSSFGPHPYRMGIFRDDDALKKVMGTILKVYYDRIGKDARARHYFTKYPSPELPPIWTLKEFLTFGNAVSLYQCLRDDLKLSISRAMGISVGTHDILTNWVVAINDLRNICAHHDRLFNRKFQKQLANYKKENVIRRGSPEYLSGLLECMNFVCDKFYTKQDYYSEISNLFQSYPAFNPREAGFN